MHERRTERRLESFSLTGWSAVALDHGDVGLEDPLPLLAPRVAAVEGAELQLWAVAEHLGVGRYKHGGVEK